MKLLLEKWRKLLEGDVVQGPWSDQSPKDPESDEYGQKISPNADIANRIEDAVSDIMTGVYGSMMSWDERHGVEMADELHRNMDKISNLLDELFPNDDRLAEKKKKRKKRKKSRYGYGGGYMFDTDGDGGGDGGGGE